MNIKIINPEENKIEKKDNGSIWNSTGSYQDVSFSK